VRSPQTALAACNGQSSKPAECGFEAVSRRHFCGGGTGAASGLAGTLAVAARFRSRIGSFNPNKNCQEFSMRDSIPRRTIPLVSAGVLASGISIAQAQTVETVMTPAPGPAVVVQAPLTVPPSGVLLPPAPTAVAVTAPVQTIETVRTVQTTEPRITRRAARPRVVDRVTTTTRTTVRQGVVAAAPPYEELRRGRRLYDVVTPAVAPPLAVSAAPVVTTTTAVAPPAAMPTYRYVYEPDRILVIDPYSNIAVQAIPR
jgi:hypothetical protein